MGMRRNRSNTQPPQASASTNSAIRASVVFADAVSQEIDRESSTQDRLIKLPDAKISPSIHGDSYGNEIPVGSNLSFRRDASLDLDLRADLGTKTVRLTPGGAHGARELFQTKPEVDAPAKANRVRQTWMRCGHCALWYAAEVRKVRRGLSLYCSIRCCAAHAAATGKFRGEKNP